MYDNRYMFCLFIVFELSLFHQPFNQCENQQNITTQRSGISEWQKREEKKNTKSSNEIEIFIEQRKLRRNKHQNLYIKLILHHIHLLHCMLYDRIRLNKRNKRRNFGVVVFFFFVARACCFHFIVCMHVFLLITFCFWFVLFNENIFEEKKKRKQTHRFHVAIENFCSNKLRMYRITKMKFYRNRCLLSSARAIIAEHIPWMMAQ